MSNQEQIIDLFNECFPAWKKEVIFIENIDTNKIAVHLTRNRNYYFGRKDTEEIFLEKMQDSQKNQSQ